MPVVCAGTLVEPGDIVVGDDDGVVVLPRRIAVEIVTAATAFIENEKGFRAMHAEQYVSLGLERVRAPSLSRRRRGSSRFEAKQQSLLGRAWWVRLRSVLAPWRTSAGS